MKDERKTKAQLLTELKELHKRVAVLEASEATLRQTEEALQASEERFRVFMENNPAVIYMKDDIGRHIYCNQTLSEKFGIRKEEFTGTTSYEFFAKDEAERLEAYDQTVRTENTLVEVPSWTDERNGEVRWWKEVKFPIAGPLGKTFVGGVCLEITNLKQAEDALKESEERYRSLVEAAPVAIVAIRNGCILFINPAGARMLGFSDQEEMLDAPVLDIVAPESQKLVTERIERLESGKDNPTAEIALIRQDGTKITVESTSVYLLIGGMPTAVIIAQDISDRKEKEEKLQMMKFTVDHALDRIAWIASDGRFLYANEAGYKEMHFTLEDLLSMSVSDIDPNFPPKRWSEHYQELRKTGSMRLQTHLIDGKGQTRYLDIHSNYIKFGGNEFICSFGRDITELKLAEQALNEQLEFERVIADIAMKLAQTGPEQLEKTIDSTLQSLGPFLRTERAFIARFSGDGGSLRFTNFWAADDIDPSGSIFEVDLVSEIPGVAQHILKGGVIKAGPGLSGLPDEAGKLRDWLEHDGISSGVVVPIRVEARSMGMLGLDTITHHRDYPQAIVDRLKILADMIGSMIHRVQAQTSLRDSLDQINQLKNRLEQENIYLREEITLQHRHHDIVGQSDAVKSVLSQAEQVAATDSTVLILGETGTGKELLAYAIHNLSSRKERPMLTVNCSALPASLIESELFGREKGAYTGALTKQMGRFEVAEGSTVFLDEISELPLELQTKLLRVLEGGTFERLGSSHTVKVDIRVIAATNRDLAKEVSQGRFREDLYYRLSVFPLTVPPPP